MPLTEEQRKIRASIAGNVRWSKEDRADLQRAALAGAKSRTALSVHVREVIENAGDLTPADLAELRAALPPVPVGEGADAC